MLTEVFETKSGQGHNVRQCACLDHICMNQLIKVVNWFLFFQLFELKN